MQSAYWKTVCNRTTRPPTVIRAKLLPVQPVGSGPGTPLFWLRAQIRPAVIPSLNARLLSALLFHVLVVEDDQLRRVEAREDQLVAIGHDVEPHHDIRHRIAEAVDIVVIVLF